MHKRHEHIFHRREHTVKRQSHERSAIPVIREMQMKPRTTHHNTRISMASPNRDNTNVGQGVAKRESLIHGSLLVGIKNGTEILPDSSAVPYATHN